MKRRKSLRNILLGTTAGISAGIFSIFNMNSVEAQNVSDKLPDLGSKTEADSYFVEPRVEGEDTLENYSANKDESQSWDGEYRHWHVTPTGDTIVSFLNEAQAREFRENQEKQMGSQKGVTDLPSDPQHPMFGLNLYVPAWDEDYQTNLDWYGSGDVDGNGIINMADYNSSITGTNPFNDGTYRGDTDLNGISGQANDKAIILDYINGVRTHINKWELESASEKESHLVNALAIDPTSEINAGSSDWLCSQYRAQLFINTTGVYDIQNSGYAENNGTNLQYDLTHNGMFRIRLSNVNTKTSSNVSHTINVAYLGDPNNQDATNFSDRRYLEPQTDLFQTNGDYSFNNYANENWYGYFYNDFSFQWVYGGRNLINYDLNQTPPTSSNIHENLVMAWTPMDDVIYPGDQTHQFPADTSVAVNGQPTDLYTGTQVSHSDNSNMTNNGTCTDVTNTTDRTWELITGDYNSTNTAAASHIQHINIEDTTPPTADFSGNLDFEYYVGIESTLNPSLFSTTNIQDNSNLPVTENVVENNSQVNNGTCSQVDFVYSNDVSLEDVCSNSLNHFYTANVSDNTPPIVGNFPEDQQVEYRPDMNLTPSAMGEPTDITDNSGLETILSHEDNSNQGVPETYNYYNFTLTRTHNVNDVCYNLTDGDQSIQVNDTESPEYTSFPEDITITKYESMGPENTGYPTWEDSSGSDVTPNYYDEQLSESPFEHYARHWTGEDYSNNTSIDSIQNITVDLLENINENLEDRAYVFPNPSNGNFTLHYNQPGTIKVGTYDLSGRQIGEEQIYENLPKDANIPYHNLNAVANGLYILKIQSEDGTVENEKVIVRK